MYTNAQELIKWIESQKRMVPKVSLERMVRICELFDNPQSGIKYIHIGGTNGKGSTVSFVKSILLEAGYNVGTFISPYIDVFNERITYNNRYISNEELLDIGNYILGKYHLFVQNNIPYLSFFEFVTLMAFIYFSRCRNLDFVILEVGLGGRLDATNIITPLVAVITSISYDHTKVLGSGLRAIAANKLGIAKPGVPLVALRTEAVFDIILETAAAKNIPLRLVNPADVKSVKVSLNKTVFDYKEYRRLKTGLLGFHQTENAALAINVVSVLKKTYGYKISTEAIQNGLKQTVWPGRLQLVSKKPPILLDGAHNPGGIRRLTEFLRAVKGHRRLRIVFAVLSDKNKAEMIDLLDSVADEMIFTCFDYRRSDNAEVLIRLSHHADKRIETDWRLLLSEAYQETTALTVFCGSLYFVSEIFNYIKKRD